MKPSFLFVSMMIIAAICAVHGVVGDIARDTDQEISDNNGSFNAATTEIPKGQKKWLKKCQKQCIKKYKAKRRFWG